MIWFRNPFIQTTLRQVVNKSCSPLNEHDDDDNTCSPLNKHDELLVEKVIEILKSKPDVFSARWR